LDKQGIGVDSYEIVDNKLKGYFEFTTSDPVTDNIVKTILKQSPKINKLKEMAKLTRSQLAEIIREELASMKGKKKQKLDENEMMNIIGPALGVIIPGAVAAWAAIKSNISFAKKQLAKQKGVEESEISDEEAKKFGAAQIRKSMEDKYGS
jgi:hypothetical protein